MKLSDYEYLYPKDDIESWQNGNNPLSKDLQNHDLCFVKYDREKNRIEVSKNGSVDFNFAKKSYESIKKDIQNLKNDETFEKYVSNIKIGAYKKDNKVVIQFTCMVLTLENFEYVLKQVSKYEL